jgi:EAL domain-containing protein (putative c-di-GMP-specific phosphodiesterase class I)
LTVVAEGVETQLQADFLTDRDCPVLQGNLFARTSLAAGLEQWLQSRAKAGARLA